MTRYVKALSILPSYPRKIAVEIAGLKWPPVTLPKIQVDAKRVKVMAAGSLNMMVQYKKMAVPTNS